MSAMDYQQLVLDTEALLAELPTDSQQRAGSQLLRTLPQLHAESSRFAARQTKRTDTDSAQAQLVLARSGFDLSKEKRALDKIDLSTAYEDFEPSAEQSLGKYLDYQHSLLINTLIEENNTKIAKSFRDMYETRLEHDWQQQKNTLLRNLTVNFMEGAPVNQQTVIAQPIADQPADAQSPLVSGRSLSKETHYCKAVCRSISDSRRNGTFACVDLFAHAAAQVAKHTATKDTSIEELWKLMQQLSKTASESRKIPASEQALLSGSIQFLETQFRQWVTSHLGNARIGGTPGIVNHIRAFLREIVFRQRYPAFLKQDIMVDDVPFWGQLFYCLRCGAKQESIDLVNLACRLYPENTQLSVIATCMVEKSRRQLSSESIANLSIDYNTFIRDQSDPFAIAVYNVISGGRFESYDNMKYRSNTEYRTLFHRYITPSHTDYLWFSMSLLEHDDVSANISRFQAQIRGFEAHFSRNQSDPLLYFLVLLLTLQYPLAISYLFSSATFRVDGVHFAMVLDQLGLLSQQQHDQNAGLVNVGLLLREYVLSGGAAFTPEQALHYILFLAKNHSDQFETLFVDLLIDNASPLEQVDAIRRLTNKENGLAREYLPSDQVDRLCLRAGQAADQDESFLIANELYRIAEPQPGERYASTLVQLLGRHLTSITSPIRRIVIERSRPLVSTLGGTVQSRTRDGIDALLQLVEIFDANHAVRFDDVHQLATFDPSTSRGFLPVSSSDLSACMTRFDYLNTITSGALARVFPELATCTMKILYNQMQVSKGRSTRLDTQALGDLREQARAFHSFYVKLESQGLVATYSELFAKFYRSINQ